MQHTAPIYPGSACPASPAGRWIEIVYEASLLDDAARPSLVFTDGNGAAHRMMAPAPVLGRAIWIGPVPRSAVALHLESHTPLRIVRVTRRGALWRGAKALLRHPKHTAAAFALAALGRPARAQKRLARALTEQPLANFKAWAAPRRRPHEPDGLDKPAFPRADIRVDLAPGESLTPWALDAVSAAFAADPALAAVRGDSDNETEAGFASAWTPGRGALFTRQGPTGPVRHIRTILTRGAPHPPAPIPTPPEPSEWPSVTVIVPTRDRLELLQTCIDGVLTGTDYPDLTLVIADNDSAEATTHAYFCALAMRDPRVRIVPCPGPFNFSAINNRAVSQNAGAMLAFLNNDIAVKDPGWLKAMVRLALQPETGAVGATLLYPNGRIQHAGVAIGPGGVAGHVLRDKPPGALAGIAGPRRVSAVTGACLVVQRARFEAAGGFDPAFPVDYNDIDLCLRLDAHGWRCVWSPETVLIHRESASRGRDKGIPEAVKLFQERWAGRIQDDPCFHPAFSENALDLALG
ncbi:MAG: glycosyltransferase [Micropepsaceae bacterium]